MYQNINTNTTANTVDNNNPCNTTPIVCPERVCVVHCTHRYKQPVVMPIRTHVVNHYVPYYCYEVVKSVSEEHVCCNKNTNLR